MEAVATHQDESAIRLLLDHTIAAFNSGDIEKAVSYHTDNVVLMESGMPALFGKKALQDLFTRLFTEFKKQQVTAHLAFTIDELEIMGHRAFVRGAVIMTKTTNDTPPIQTRGKFLSLFQKQADGSWLRSHIVSNTDAPESFH